MDTQQQNFWKETINKEAAVRFAWHLKFSKRFAKEAAKDMQADAPRPSWKNRSVANTQANIQAHSTISKRIKQLENEGKTDEIPSNRLQSNGVVKQKDDKVAHGQTGKVYREMRPASQKTRSLLFSGISHHGEGRYSYLQKRKFVSPDEKYKYPILSSCDFGWKIKDYGGQKASPFARTCIVRDTFFRHSGIAKLG